MAEGQQSTGQQGLGTTIYRLVGRRDCNIQNSRAQGLQTTVQQGLGTTVYRIVGLRNYNLQVSRAQGLHSSGQQGLGTTIYRFLSSECFKGTVVNRALSSLPGGSLKVTVILSYFLTQISLQEGCKKILVSDCFSLLQKQVSSYNSSDCLFLCPIITWEPLDGYD